VKILVHYAHSVSCDKHLAVCLETAPNIVSQCDFLPWPATATFDIVLYTSCLPELSRRRFIACQIWLECFCMRKTLRIVVSFEKLISSRNRPVHSRSVVPNRWVATPKWVAEEFLWGREQQPQ